jgi:hypothetical protein
MRIAIGMDHALCAQGYSAIAQRHEGLDVVSGADKYSSNSRTALYIFDKAVCNSLHISVFEQPLARHNLLLIMTKSQIA